MTTRARVYRAGEPKPERSKEKGPKHWTEVIKLVKTLDEGEPVVTRPQLGLYECQCGQKFELKRNQLVNCPKCEQFLKTRKPGEANEG